MRRKFGLERTEDVVLGEEGLASCIHKQLAKVPNFELVIFLNKMSIAGERVG